MNKCKFCGKEVNGKYRCENCDRIWQDGFKEGEQFACFTLSNLFKNIQDYLRKNNE